MVDGVLVLNEVIDFTKRKKRECLLVKVDFATAYNCVSWEYLGEIMVRMGFGYRWFKWMDALVFSSSLSVSVNRSPTFDFLVKRVYAKGIPYPFSWVY